MRHTYPIYVINLKHASKRRKQIKRCLDKQSVDYTIVTAVDKRNLPALSLDKYDPSLAKHYAKRELTQGEIACAMSHANIWSRIVELDQPYALVLEDDAIIDDDFWNLLNSIDKFPKNWGIFNFHSDSTNYKLHKNWIGKISLKKFDDKMNRTTAYLITKEAAIICLKYAYPIKKAVDGTLNTLVKMQKIAAYGTCPQLVSTDEEKFPSDIGKR